MEGPAEVDLSAFTSKADLSAFVSKAYERHDGAHDLKHIQRVMTNAAIIMSCERDTFDMEDKKIYFVTLAMHDARDHKLVDRGACLPQAQIDEFYAQHFTPAEIARIKFIHANCSWTSRAAKVGEGDLDDPLLHLMRDADWLDALGQIGIERVNLFQQWKQPGTSQEEIDLFLRRHIQEKLLHIPNALKFATSRALVHQRGLMEPLREFLARKEPNVKVD